MSEKEAAHIILNYVEGQFSDNLMTSRPSLQYLTAQTERDGGFGRSVSRRVWDESGTGGREGVTDPEVVTDHLVEASWIWAKVAIERKDLKRREDLVSR